MQSARHQPRKSRLLAIAVSVIAALGSFGAHAATPPSGPFTDIVYANGRYVAVGATNRIFWSTDAINWSAGVAAGVNQFVAVIHNGSQFVALTDQGKLLKSADATAWALLGEVNTDGDATDLAYGAGKYVVVDTWGDIYASSDGAAWALAFAPSASEELYRVAFGNGRFVAVGIHYSSGSDSYGLIRSSANGTAWTRERQKLNEELYGVEFVNGEFVATGVTYNSDFDTFSQVLASTYGTTWGTATVPGSATLYGAAYGNGVYALPGGEGSVLVLFGGSWAQRWSGDDTETFAAVAFGAAGFVAVGDEGITLRSPDGLSWIAPVAPAPTVSLYGIAAGPGLVVAGDDWGQAGLWLAEADGSWGNVAAELRDSDSFYDSFYIRDVTYANGVYVAVGWHEDENGDPFGLILRSTDGRWWSTTTRTTTGEALYGVGYGNGLFVAVGERYDSLLHSYDVILTSPDGLTWTSRSANTGNDAVGLRAVHYAAGHFVAVGLYGTVIESANGLNWFPMAVANPPNLCDITFGLGQYVAVGETNKLLISTNTEDWELRSINYPATLNAITFHNGAFYTVGAGGFAAKSSDLTTWTPLTTGVTNTLWNLAFLDEQLWVVGEDGTVKIVDTTPAPLTLTLEGQPAPGNGLVLHLHGPSHITCRILTAQTVANPASWTVSQTVSLGPTGTANVTLTGESSLRFFKCVTP